MSLTMDLVKKHMLTLAGLVVIAIGALTTMVGTDSNVPNDPNIGAGVLFVFGIVLVIAGVAHAWTRRNQPAPPSSN